MSGSMPNLGAGAEGVDGARRVEGWAGEVRLNLVRLAALTAFYAYHLMNVLLSRDDPVLTGAYHVAATALVMVWAIGVVVLYLYLSRRQVPPALKYAVTAWDTVLITTLLALAGGPQSPLVILYFLVIAAAPLRLSLRLVYVATGLAVAGYLFLLGHYVFYQVGYERYYSHPEVRIPRTQEAIFLLGLLTSGVLAGQVVRQARRLAWGLPVASETGAPETEARADSRFVAAGLVVVAILVALGLLYSVFAGPPSLAGNPTLPVVAVIGVVFAVAVLAALAEIRKPAGQVAQGAGPLPAPDREERS
jgi:hypothetical protein